MMPDATKLKLAIGTGAWRRQVIKLALAAILAPLILEACAAANKPPPEVPDIPLLAYGSFELPPVANQSGQPAGAEARI